MTSDYDENNIFAKILRSQIDCKKIKENDYALAFLDINPQAPVHILVIPKNPYIDIYDFNKNALSVEILGFWELLNCLIDDQDVKNNGFRVISNSGQNGNQDVPHFHLHLLAGKNLGRMIKLSS